MPHAQPFGQAPFEIQNQFAVVGDPPPVQHAADPGQEGVAVVDVRCPTRKDVAKRCSPPNTARTLSPTVSR
jgi:hypothetical protein